MTAKRAVARHPSIRDDIGDLVTRRPLPGAAVEQIDPFLFLNHHGPQIYPPHNAGLPFGPHPHRGFETVTFIVQGELMHRDTAGHESVIHAGGVQWMTAGRGLVHAEISSAGFKRDGGPLEILQLWVNLPARLKMTAPAYVGLQREEIPALATTHGAATLHLVAGTWNGHTGPIRSLTGVFMSTLDLARAASLAVDGLGGRNVFLYVVRGSVEVGGTHAQAHELVELDTTGDTVQLVAGAPTLLLFGHAQPLAEPVVSYGPFVMNTRAEIDTAIRDYRAGAFGGAL